MQTELQTKAPEIPDFKLAKVGEKRERRKGALPFLPGAGGAGSGFQGALGSLLGGGGLASTGLSVGQALLIIALTTGITAAAWTVGSMVRGDDSSARAEKKLWAPKDDGQYQDLTGVISADDRIPNSLGFLQREARDGMTDEERAKLAAEEEARRKAEEEAAAKAAAEEEERIRAEEEAAAKAAAEKPVGETIATTGPNAGALAQKFGKLTSGMGGGSPLSGGAGLSGGIARGFMNPNAAKGAPAGQAQAMRRPTRANFSRAQGRPATGRAKGVARRQLGRVHALSRHASSTGRAETASESAAAGFDNNAGIGAAIQGPGVGAGVSQGGAGVGSGTNPTTPVEDCPQGQALNSSGQCQKVNDTSSKNAAKYQHLINMVMMLMAIASVLAMIGIAFPPAQPIIAAVLAMIGAAISGMGVQMMQQGADKMQGGIVIAVGGFTAAAGLAAMISPAMYVMAAAGAMIANAVGALMASAKQKPAAWQ